MIRQFLYSVLPKPALLKPLGSDIDKTTHRHVQQVLTNIETGYDLASFRLDTFVKWIESQRNRPIELVPLHLSATVSGGWLQLAEKDFIFYEKETLPVHQVHIQLHELSHMLCGHGAADVGETSDIETLKQLFAYMVDLHENPTRRDVVIEPLLLRARRSAPEELEAEYLSELILERVSARQFEAAITQPVTFSRMAVGVYEAMRMA